jgi:hypothetical protein
MADAEMIQVIQKILRALEDIRDELKKIASK